MKNITIFIVQRSGIMRIMSFLQALHLLIKEFNKGVITTYSTTTAKASGTVGIMSIKQYALLGVAILVTLVAVIAYTNKPVDSDTVSAQPQKVETLDYQLESVKADNESVETMLKQEEERLEQLETERLELEGQL